MSPFSKEHRRKLSEAKMGSKNPQYGRPHSEEHKRKIAESLMGRKRPEAVKRKISESSKGKIRTEESMRKQSEANKGKTHSKLSKRKMSEILKGNQRALGHKQSDEHKRKISAGLQGINLEEWEGYVAYEPYCHLFNLATKERVRNQHLRTCVITGKSILQEGRKLSVHHVDNNKQQGCDGIKWRLVPVTNSWNGKLRDKQAGLLLNLLLIKNPRAQINVGQGFRGEGR